MLPRDDRGAAHEAETGEYEDAFANNPKAAAAACCDDDAPRNERLVRIVYEGGFEDEDADASAAAGGASGLVESYHVVKVASQYLLPGNRPMPAKAQEQPKEKKGWRKRTHAMQQQTAASARPRLCNHVNRGDTCPFEGTCKFSHDVQSFLAARDPDIGPKCPVLEATGVCPMGYSCRFVGAHLSPEQFGSKNFRNTNSELLTSLQRKTYDFKGVHQRDEAPKPIDLRGKVYVAPLTTVGNLPFRRILVQLGADVTCGEMAMARQLMRGSPSEWALTKRHPSEKIFGIQVAGCDAREMGKVAELISRETNADFVDINLGCPISEVTDHGAGSALLQRATRIEQIVDAVNHSAPTVHLGLKMRIGWSDDKLVAHQIISRMKDKKLLYTMVHGRSRLARYTKKANWEYIANDCAKAAMDIGVQFLGNGDVLHWSDYQRAITSKEEGGYGVGAPIAAALIGRGALVKPWICTEIKEQRVWDISASERLELYRNFANFGLEHWGSDQRGVDTTRRYMLEWLSFAHRYVPVGLLETGTKQELDMRLPYFQGRSDLETLLASPSARDWERISEMFLGPIPEGFVFAPKHKANAW